MHFCEPEPTRAIHVPWQIVAFNRPVKKGTLQVVSATSPRAEQGQCQCTLKRLLFTSNHARIQPVSLQQQTLLFIMFEGQAGG